MQPACTHLERHRAPVAPCARCLQANDALATCRPRDYVGFGSSMLSILLWMVAQFPQYYTNYKTKTVEALSPWFLAQWLLVRHSLRTALCSSLVYTSVACP